MAKVQRKQPKPAFKKFFSMREVRVASTSGHVAIVPANKATELPKQLWQEAAKSGAIEYDPDLIRAAARAVDEAQAEEPKLSFSQALERAVRELVAAGKPSTLNRNTGAPKIAAVRDTMAALDVSAKALRKLTNDLVYDTFVGLTGSDDDSAEAETQEESPGDADLADEDGIDEPVGEGLKGLLASTEGDETDEE